MSSSEIKRIDGDTMEIEGDGIYLDETKTNRIKKNLDKYEKLFGIDEQSSNQPITTRKELWSYYLYYNVRIISLMEVHSF